MVKSIKEFVERGKAAQAAVDKIIADGTMNEVIALEKEIRALLFAAIHSPLKSLPKLRQLMNDGESIIAGRTTVVSGNRLDRLRQIALGLRAFLEPPKF